MGDAGRMLDYRTAKEVTSLKSSGGPSEEASVDRAMGEPRARAPHPSTLGRFRVEAPLGSGSFGNVYKAFDPLVGEHVALKVLRPEAGRDRVQMERLRREVVLARKIDHPGVCRIYDLHEDGGALFIVMKLIDGEPLNTLCARGPIEPLRAVRIIEDVCRALAAAHDAGVLHRDIKPGNVMVRARDDGTDEVTLVDFGIALGQGLDHLTQPGVAVGTAGYLALELWEGGEATPASDVFATGVMLYSALTGRLPWRGPHLALVDQMRTVPAAPPSMLAARPSPGSRPIDARLDEIVLRAIALSARRRFASARALADELAAWRAEDGARTDDIPLASVTSVEEGSVVEGSGTAPVPLHLEDDPPANAPRSRPLVAIIVGGAAVAALGALAVMMGDRSPPAPGGEPVAAVAALAATPSGPTPAAPAPLAATAPATTQASGAPASSGTAVIDEVQEEEPTRAVRPRAPSTRKGARAEKVVVVDRALVEKKLARLQSRAGSASSPKLDALSADIAADIAAGRYGNANTKLDRALALVR